MKPSAPPHPPQAAWTAAVGVAGIKTLLKGTIVKSQRLPAAIR